MNLLIDWGNTFLKYIIIDTSFDIESQLSIEKVKKSDSLDRLVSELSNYCAKHTISMAYISSVRKSLDNEQLSLILNKLEINCTFVKTEKRFGHVSCAYEEFETLGVDRWLTIVATQPSKNIIGIIDVGSAITIDVVGKNGQHLGGQIVPGNKLLLDSLKATDRVIVSEQLIDRDESLLGVSTDECVKFGVDQMIQGYLENSISEVTKHHQVEQWIFTGGGGEYWCEKLSVSQNNHYTHDGLLVFRGLIKYINY
ncbi:MAG: hypothetical protein COA86_16950 [Kangiella sp.]|nr:MAG: hypothetical protein COA86_16950 [Kangiella sp.]